MRHTTIKLAVYPRVCGGTKPIIDGMADAGGLSPRVRGNLLLGLALPGIIRSIPACAGEPRSGVLCV